MTLAFGLGAQTVTLTFTGRGSDNSYVKIDRVVITNLSKSWQETIWWPDTTLIMQNGTSIDDYSENGGFALSQNNPNPFSSTTDVSLTVAEEGKVQLEIADMNGHAVVEPQYFTSLQPDNHQFRVSLSTAGTYVMTARQNGKLTSIKMICNGGGGANAIDYLGSMQSLTYVLKSSTTNPFNFGDMMEYVGYATINGAEMESQRITQAQGASQTFMLQFSIAQTPNAPTNVSATLSGSQIQITWNSVSNATSYKVYRSSSASGSYIQIGTPSSNNYYDANPLTGYNYYKVKAVNSAGESDYSTVASCYNSSGDGQPCPNMATITDYDNNTYNTVKIGGQCWMKENLRTKHYADGTSISQGTSVSDDTAYWYYPNGQSLYEQTYGLLYNWPAVMKGDSPSDGTPSGVQGICPNGWHVPSNSEWSQLIDYLSKQNLYWCGADSHKIAKSLASSVGWNSATNICAVGYLPNNNNATGLNIFPAGQFRWTGSDYGSTGIGISANIWSSTMSGSFLAFHFELFYANSSISQYAITEKHSGNSVRCLRNEGSSQLFPTVITSQTINNITSTTATCSGNVINEGGSSITACGICWSTMHNPTIADSHTFENNVTNGFSSNIIGLSSNLTYFARAYATNLYGTSYGDEVSFTTSVNSNGDAISCAGTPILTDVDGNVYNTVQIGEQCWMRENLRTTHYADGSAISLGGNNGSSQSIGYWYYPNGDSTCEKSYGLLYNWPATMHGEASSNVIPSGVQGVCPSGWHVPSDTEWSLLKQYVRNQNQYWCDNNSNNIAKSLASIFGWSNNNLPCYPGNDPSSNNSTGFGALPAGYCYYYPPSMCYYGFDNSARFWSSSENSITSAVYYYLSSDVGYLTEYKRLGHSVRCILGAGSTVTTPGTPTNVTASVSGSQIYVSWNPVSNATNYKVYRSSTASGTYTQIGSATSNTYLYDSSPLTGYNYYKVKAVNSAGESDYSSYASCNYITVPDAPTNVAATLSGSQIQITWNSVSNATSYNVYRSSTASGTYTQIGSATSNTYLYDSSPLTGYNYYKVTAVNSAGESSYSSVVSCNYVTIPNAPTNVSATVSGSQVYVSWGAVSNATSYKVYRSSTASGTYTQIGSATSNTYLYDSSPMTGYNYYKVKAVNSAGESSYSSYAYCNYSGGATVPSAPTGVSATVSGSQIYVSWGSVSNATSYKVYRSSTANGTYSQIGSATSNTYLYDSAPLSGYNYYKVKAVNSAGESSYSTYAYCNYSGGATIPNAPTGVSATVSGSLIYVSWNSVSNATSYSVYRSTSASGSYSLIGSPTSTYFYDSSPLTGYNYYKVTAVNSAGESSYSTYAYCNYSGGATVPSAPTGVTATVLGNSANSYVSVSWTPVSNATGYQVYRSSSASGTFSLIGSTTSSTPYYYDYNPLSGYNYYKVKAVNSAGESSYSSIASCYCTPPTMSPCPPSVSVSGTSSQTVSWTPVVNSGCGTPTSYKVYHKNPCNGNAFELMTTTTSTSYSVSSSNVHPGVNQYIVEAINSTGNSQTYASSSSVSLSAPSTFSVQKLSGGYLKFTWSAVSKATGYQIFISDHPSPNSGYTIMSNGWINGGSTTTTTIYYPGTSGTTMYFKMKAFYDCGGYWELSNLTSTYKSITF